MKIGVYQFASTNIIAHNLAIIQKAICLASKSDIRLLVFHECALCAYPPIECKIDEIVKEEIEHALIQISNLAKEHKIFVAVGTVRFENDQRFNSVIVINDNGDGIPIILYVGQNRVFLKLMV